MLPSKRAPLPLALYLHFPWCLHKCSYCDFNSRALTVNDRSKIVTYKEQLCHDLEHDAAPYVGTKLVSIYFGGGTPSLLSLSALAEILVQVKAFFVVDKTTEITLEANPGTLNLDYCRALAELGINRVSLGAQSFHNAILAQIGRIHTAEQIESAVEKLHKAKITKLNLDLIFGLPHHTVTSALDDLMRALRLPITHLSWYQLTLEEFKRYAAIYRERPNDEELTAIQEAGENFLKSQGFHHYEVAAFARNTDSYCRHNLNYWTFGDYLGIGCGAHSKITSADYQVVRTVKWEDPGTYLRADDFYAKFKVVSSTELPFEFMLNALRLYSPLSYQLFYERTGLQLKVLDNQLKQAEELGLLQRRRDDLIVTPHGKNFLNDLLELFL